MANHREPPPQPSRTGSGRPDPTDYPSHRRKAATGPAFARILGPVLFRSQTLLAGFVLSVLLLSACGDDSASTVPSADVIAAAKGGQVLVTKSNILIRLAPYFFPL